MAQSLEVMSRPWDSWVSWVSRTKGTIATEEMHKDVTNAKSESIQITLISHIPYANRI
jgi:hypothetical protein